jgi:hypothetical protein
MATPQGTVWRPGKDKIGNGPVVLADGDKLTTISPSLPDGYTSIFTSGPAKDKIFYAIQNDGKVTYASFDDTGKKRRQYNTIQELADGGDANAGFQINPDNINLLKSRMIEIFNQGAFSAGLITSTPSIDPNLSKTPPNTGSGNVTASVISFLASQGINIDASILKLDKDLGFKFGAVDDVIKKMKRPLNYPEHALYNNTQDYLSIAQYSYKPPRSNDIFGDPLNTLRNGSKRTSPLQELLGMVNLPMPNNITDSNNVSWADDNMNNLSAALTSYVTNDPLKTLAGATALRAGASAAGIGGGAAQIASFLGALGGMGAFGAGATPEMKKLLGGTVNSQVLSMLGVSVSPESILARGYGIVPNSNIELLFNAPTLREFTFQYRMSPRSSSEAKIINNIIRFFKQGMAAKKISSISGGGSAGAQSYFLGTPNVFQLQYKTSGGKTIKGVNRIKTCALTGFAMNYAADGNWAAYDEGQPVSVIMNMSFKELEPVYDTDYQSNVEPGREFIEGKISDNGDLYRISDDEVGY